MREMPKKLSPRRCRQDQWGEGQLFLFHATKNLCCGPSLYLDKKRKHKMTLFELCFKCLPKEREFSVVSPKEFVANHSERWRKVACKKVTLMCLIGLSNSSQCLSTSKKDPKIDFTRKTFGDRRSDRSQLRRCWESKVRRCEDGWAGERAPAAPHSARSGRRAPLIRRPQPFAHTRAPCPRNSKYVVCLPVDQLLFWSYTNAVDTEEQWLGNQRGDGYRNNAFAHNLLEPVKEECRCWCEIPGDFETVSSRNVLE